MLIRLDYARRRILLFGREGDGKDLGFVKALFLGGGVLLLRGERELVGLLARDAEVLRHVVAGLWHRVVAVLLDEPAVREAHADGGVVHLHVAAEGRVRLAHDIRRAAHALHAAGDVKVALVAGHRARGIDHRLQAARAQAIHGHARCGGRQAGEQRGEARDVAVVLAGLVDAAHDDVAYVGRLHLVARYDFADHLRGKIVGPQRRELAGVAADRGTQSVVDVGIEHVRVPLLLRGQQGNAELRAAPQPWARPVARLLENRVHRLEHG